MSRPQNRKLSEGVSPWRAAKSRRPLSEVPSPTDSYTNNYNGLDFSPPNSSNKESTRLDNGGILDMSNGSSPALGRGVETTKRNTRSKKSPVVKTTKKKSDKQSENDMEEDVSGSNDDEEGTDDDQPAAKCQYVGQNSNSIANQSKEKSLRKRQISQQCSVRTEETALNSCVEVVEVPAQTGCGYLLCILIIMIVLGLGSILIYKDQMNKSPNLTPPDQLSVKHWKEMRLVAKDDLQRLMKHFPNQNTSGFWTSIRTGIRSPMQVFPDYPGVLILLTTSLAKDTARCLATRLVEISSKVFSKPGIIPPNPLSLTIECGKLPQSSNAAKELLTASLDSSLSTGSAVALLDIEMLNPYVALTLHAFADNSNAPFKHAVIVAVLEVEDSKEPCNLEQKAENALGKVWGAQLGQDKFAALISRLVVNVVEVSNEASHLSIC